MLQADVPVRNPNMYRSVRRIQCWNDLEAFGIKPLTGEACGLAMRLLCDVTAQGKALVKQFLRCELTRDNWNGGSKTDPHVNSIMLPRSIFTDQAAFVLVATRTRTDTSIAAFADGGAVEYSGNEYIPSGLFGRHYARSTAPGTGIDNEHMATGRVE